MLKSREYVGKMASVETPYEPEIWLKNKKAISYETAFL
jgi:hypothetical protein